MKAFTWGPAGLSLAAVLLLCVVTPPEVRGLGMVAAAAFVAVAATATSGFGARAAPSGLVYAALGLVLVAARAARAPGEAIEPAATLFIAAFAGLAAAGSDLDRERPGALYAVLLAAAGGRALYETAWGLSHWADSLRASSPPGMTDAILNRLEQGRPYAGFSTPAALGCFLAMAIPAVAAWALSQLGRARVLGLLAAALGTAALLATRSLTAMAALAAALALAALRGRVAGRLLVAATVVIGLAVIGVGAIRPDAVFAPTGADSPWRLRAGNVRIALEIARDHPLAGVGPGGYAEAFPLYRRSGDNESRHAHNLPAELMAEWGVPVGLVLSALFFWAFLSPLLAGTVPPRTFASGLGIGLAAFALHNVADFTAFLPSLLMIAAISRGFLTQRVAQERARPAPRVAWVGIAIAVCVVAATSGLARDALFAAREAAVNADHAGALRLARHAQRLAPWDPDPPLVAAGALIAAQASPPSAALEEAVRAVDRAPERASARAMRAQARIQVGDSEGAYADLVEAARLYPLRSEYTAQRDALADALGLASRSAPR